MTKRRDDLHTQGSAPSTAHPRERRPPDPRAIPRVVPFLGLAGLVGLVAWNISSVGYFADDFHFLDVSRRAPLLDLVDGHAGIAPWYRPLSRELFFALLVACGRFGLVVAHLVQCVTVLVSAWQIRSIGRTLLGPLEGAVGATLFVMSGMTLFLASWASGFQDGLATALVLTAVSEHLAGRHRSSALFTFAALFAKEWAVVVAPLLLLFSVAARPPLALRRWVPWQAAAFVLAGTLHLLARSTWGGHASPVPSSSGPAAIIHVVEGLLSSFVARPAPLTVAALLAALVGLVAALILMRSADREARRDRGRAGASGNWTRPGILVVAAILITAMPVFLGLTAGVLAPHAYYGYATAPWLALGVGWIAGRLPRPAAMLAVCFYATWNAAFLLPKPVELSDEASWHFRRWDWAEAQRLSAVSRSLQADLRALFPASPGNMTILLSGLDTGCYLQTEDGPATREALGNRNVRSFWVSEAPFGLRPGEYDVLVFNPETRHLERHALPTGVRLTLAANALARDRAGTAWAFALYGDTESNTNASLRYLLAAAALAAGGPAEYERVLRAAGMFDNSPEAARAWAERLVPRGSPVLPRVVEVMRQPMSAQQHLQLADALHATGEALPELVELRIAVCLDSSLTAVRDRLEQSASELTDRGMR